MTGNQSGDLSVYNHLYGIPIEQLGLSASTCALLRETGAESVGDCVVFFISLHEAMMEVRTDVWQVLATEVKEKLKEHGYWHYTQYDDT